jgi:monoamine oxidase
MTFPITRPVLAEPSSDVDVAIIGAGSAGIAAARALRAARLTVAIIEARDRVGGRAVTAQFGGHAIDLGAHWLHAGLLNPLVREGQAHGERLRRAPAASHLVVGGRFARPGERREHGRGFELMERAFAQAARAEQDKAAANVVPLLGRWRAPVVATHALVSGRPLSEVSVKDYPSDEFGDNYFIAGGYGAFIARLAANLPVALSAPVTAIDWSGSGVSVETLRGSFRAQAAIVTIPVPVLQAGGVRFRPGLPDTHREAVAAFLPGTYEHVVLNWPDAPFTGPDRLAKLVGRRTNLGLMTRIDAAPFHYMELDHEVAAPLSDRPAAFRFAREVLGEHFGARALHSLRIVTATEWRRDPWSLCAWSVIPPGRHRARDALREPIDGRIWFAGEATSIGQWGTVGGAWEEGEGAARSVTQMLRSSVFAPVRSGPVSFAAGRS